MNSERDVVVRADGTSLAGLLGVPDPAVGIVVFAHGSGSSRLSTRNRSVAADLRDAGLATLLFDLLTQAEDGDRELVFDIPLLARRLVGATRWLRAGAGIDLPLCYFGASTGAAAALVAAAELGDDVRAVVSRGGRPDLAIDRIGEVTASTLLIVGGMDPIVLELNQQAARAFNAEAKLQVVSGASHLFEERGALEVVSDLASGWFLDHLAAGHVPHG